ESWPPSPSLKELLPMRSFSLPHSLDMRSQSPVDRPRRIAGLCRLSMAGWIGWLALSGAAHAASYTLQATVKDIDGRPLAGIQVAVGAIQKGTLKDDLQADATGTTDASGQVTIKLSSDASLVGAMVMGEDPG